MSFAMLSSTAAAASGAMRTSQNRHFYSGVMSSKRNVQNLCFAESRKSTTPAFIGGSLCRLFGGVNVDELESPIGHKLSFSQSPLVQTSLSMLRNSNILPPINRSFLPMKNQNSLNRCHGFHSSSTMLMMAKQKKNGGKRKSKMSQTSSGKKKQSVVASEDDDDEFNDLEDGELDLESLSLEEDGDDSSAVGGSNSSPFASEYHAPVMFKECIDALLTQDAYGDLLLAKKDRWRKKRNIMEAKRKRAGYYEEEEEEEDEDDDEGNDLKEETRSEDPNSAGHTQRPRIFIDGTLGGGGHSEAILQQLNPGDILIGCDVDPAALATASKRLVEYLGTCDYILDNKNSEDQLVGQWEEGKPMFIPVQSNFRNLISALSRVRHPATKRLLLGDRRKRQNRNASMDDDEDEEIVEFPYGANGMLLDLGVSSHQIDTGERGFAFMKDGPLDMRMSGNSNNSSSTGFSGSSLTAADICNEFDEVSIIDILRTYGDEPRAKRIASAIVASRPLYTTTDLVHAINTVTPTFARQRRAGLIATSSRVFQALRIVVNEEDGALKEVLEGVAPMVLSGSGGYSSSRVDSIDGQRPDGILAVLSYHSMEDKMAKRVIRDGSVNLEDGGRRRSRSGVLERDMYGNVIDSNSDGNGTGNTNSQLPFEPLGKPRKATDEEIEMNRRARSATLRVAIRI